MADRLKVHLMSVIRSNVVWSRVLDLLDRSLAGNVQGPKQDVTSDIPFALDASLGA